MPRHTDTPADHCRGVRGPVVIAAVLLLLGPLALLAFRAQHQRRAVEYEAIRHQQERARKDADLAREDAVRAATAGRE